MEAEIKEIIAKHLPEQVGKTLKERLQKADEDASQLEYYKAENKEQDEKIRELQRKISAHVALDSRKQSLNAREENIEKRERQLEIEKLRYELESEKEKTDFTKKVALGLVRNIEYRRTLFDNQTGPDGVDQYGNQRYANSSQNSEETKSAH